MTTTYSVDALMSKGPEPHKTVRYFAAETTHYVFIYTA
jgi:hypothetical protein